MAAFTFPKWTNSIKILAAIVLGGGPVYAAALIWIGFSPMALNRGYAPEQPVPYSHALHAGELGIDCRYCHNTVEEAGFAAIPPTDTCMNCHTSIWPESNNLELVRASAASGESVEWIKVHDLPDYAYFDHSAHVARGVSCVSCHGRVDRMEVVEMVTPLSMSWCLDCHRDPDPNIRPKELVTKLDFDTERDWTSIKAELEAMQLPSLRSVNLGAFGSWGDFAAGLRAHYNLNPNTDCSTCHR